MLLEVLPKGRKNTHDNDQTEAKASEVVLDTLKAQITGFSQEDNGSEEVRKTRMQLRNEKEVARMIIEEAWQAR